MAPKKPAGPVTRGKAAKRSGTNPAPKPKNPYKPKNTKGSKGNATIPLLPIIVPDGAVPIPSVLPKPAAGTGAGDVSNTSMRVTVLETDVVNIKTKVDAIHDKLELIIDSNLSRQDSRAHSTPRKGLYTSRRPHPDITFAPSRLQATGRDQTHLEDTK